MNFVPPPHPGLHFKCGMRLLGFGKHHQLLYANFYIMVEIKYIISIELNNTKAPDTYVGECLEIRRPGAIKLKWWVALPRLRNIFSKGLIICS